MNEKFNSLLSIAIVPQVIDLIVKKENIEEIQAVNEFYKSKTYEFLADESSKVWHYSPLTIYHIWKSEKDTGELLFPEEGGL